MKQQTRKKLSKIGAGLMLGMSLFNFGAIWTRQGSGQVPSRTKNIRQKEKEQLDQETKEVALIAERHANEAISAERVQMEQQDQITGENLQRRVGTEDSTIFQQTLRYGVITVWTVALGIVFSSALLDFPISIGKKILAIVPEISQAATISLEPQKAFFQENEEIIIDVFVETKELEIKSMMFVFKFDPEIMEFEGIGATENFSKIDVKRIDENFGTVSVVLENPPKGIDFGKKRKVARMKFQGKTAMTLQKVIVLKEKSNIIANFIRNGKIQKVNLLRKTEDARFSIISGSGKKIRCGNPEGISAEKEITKEMWERVLLETKLPMDALVWQDAGNETYFMCAIDTKRTLHLLVRRKDALEKMEIFIEKRKIKSTQEDSWKEDNSTLYSFSYNLEEAINLNMNLEGVMLRFDGELSWPKKGLAELVI